MTIKILGKKLEMRIEAVVIIVSLIILLGCLIGYFFFSDDSDIIIESKIEGTTDIAQQTASPETAPQETGKAADEGSDPVGNTAEDEITAAPVEMIKVYVVGCVRKPGIVTIKKGDLIDDAVREAGGLTEDADASNINMVYALNENTMLYIKARKELNEEEASNVPLSTSGERKNTGKGVKLIKESGEGAEVTGSSETSETSAGSIDGKVVCININTAGVDELDTLPGIGEATAKDIVAFRDANGPFTKIEDIMKVPRIKQGRFDSIKDLIAVN